MHNNYSTCVFVLSSSAPVQVVTEAHFGVDGMDPLRVVTTRLSCTSHLKGLNDVAPINLGCTVKTSLPRHMPDAPFGRAPAEFADCLASIVKGEKLPTVLLGDLSFPEKAFGQRMCAVHGHKSRHKHSNANVCQKVICMLQTRRGSLLLKLTIQDFEMRLLMGRQCLHPTGYTSSSA